MFDARYSVIQRDKRKVEGCGFESLVETLKMFVQRVVDILFGSADSSWTNRPSLKKPKKKKSKEKTLRVLEAWNFILPTFVFEHIVVRLSADSFFYFIFIVLANRRFAGWSWYDVGSTKSWLKWLYCDELTDSNNYVVMPEFREHSGKRSGLPVVVVCTCLLTILQ